VARELFIAHTLHRHFVWTVNVLWVEDLTHIGELEEQRKEKEQEGETRTVEDKREGQDNDRAEPDLLPLLRAHRLLSRLPRLSSNSPSPSKCYVFLSEQDDIIHAPSVSHYLKDSTAAMLEEQVARSWREQTRGEAAREGKAEFAERLSEAVCSVTMWKGFRHAQFLLSSKAQLQIMKSIKAAEGMLAGEGE
jgi:hypothetical protein